MSYEGKINSSAKKHSKVIAPSDTVKVKSKIIEAPILEKGAKTDSVPAKATKTIQKALSRTIKMIEPQQLPERIKRIYNKKGNYTEKDKKKAQKRKADYANKVGWVKRGHHHRHAHQAKREQQILNYMSGIPLEHDEYSD